MAVATTRRTTPRTAKPGILMRHPVARDALFAWVGQRILLVGLVVFWQLVTGVLSPRNFFHVWTTWDGRLYGTIAHGGYTDLWEAAFYPLFPLLEHLLAPLAAGSVEGAGLIVANAASLGVFVLLRLVVGRDLGTQVARRTLAYLALCPVGFFLACAYTESLFLLLALGTFAALRTQRWSLAGVLMALATLTRVTGLTLLLPYAVAVFQSLAPRLSKLGKRERQSAFAAVGLPALLPLAMVTAVQLGMSLHFGLLWAMERAEAQSWGRWLDWPWMGILRSAAMVVAHPPSVASMDLLTALLWLGLACSMLLPSARRLPGTYIAYTWGLLALTLATPVHLPGDSPLVSISRYTLLAFPCFIRIAQLSLHSWWVLWALLALSGTWLLVLSRLFALGAFIA